MGEKAHEPRTPLREGIFNRKAVGFSFSRAGHGILLGLWLGRQHGKGGSSPVNLSLEGKRSGLWFECRNREGRSRADGCPGAKVTLVARRADA